MQVGAAFIILFSLIECATTATNRSVAWWYDVGNNAKTDQNNIATIRAHRGAFTRVMPCYDDVILDGNISHWWGRDKEVSLWNAPLQEMKLDVLPYLIDIDNATIMHLIYANRTAWIKDAVAVAEHYGFQGWFLDYEDEYPPDTAPDKNDRLRGFLNELGDALHAKNMRLDMCVASWSHLLSNYTNLARSSLDRLQLMSTYANPSNSKELIETYFKQVAAGAPSRGVEKAGVGIGIYYDGHGYPKEWTNESARAFVASVSAHGGNELDIFRLLNDGTHTWPYDGFWWRIFEDFLAAKL